MRFTSRFTGSIYDTRFATILITLLSVMAYWRIWIIQDVISDDNAWLLAIYAVDGVDQFLETGPTELKRIILGILTYWFFSLHRNTDHFYAVWHGIDTVTQIVTPLLFYKLIRHLFHSPQLALLSAIGFVAFPLDYTLPYATVTNYRLGLLFGLGSLYFTSISLSQSRLLMLPMAAALLTGGASYYVFMEAAIALEPARTLLIAYSCYHNDQARRVWISRAISVSIIYMLAFTPLIIGKLLYTPQGRYEGLYQFRPDFILQWWDIAKALAHFGFLQWFILSRYLYATTPAMYMMAFLGTLIAYGLFRADTNRPTDKPYVRLDIHTNRYQRKWVIYFIATFTLPVIIIFHAFNRPISWGLNSYHALLAQPGYALLIGWTFLYLLSAPRARFKPVIRIVLSAWIGIGIYFSNLNIEMFRHSWARQTEFWDAFEARFPVLPKKGTFFFDVQHNTLYPDPTYYYDFEFMLNLLYAETSNSEEFRRYKAFTVVELDQSRANPNKNSLGTDTIERNTLLGLDKLRPADFIVVHYRDGSLLVNNEILSVYPNVSYKQWLVNKVFPTVPNADTTHYRWRGKLNMLHDRWVKDSKYP